MSPVLPGHPVPLVGEGGDGEGEDGEGPPAQNKESVGIRDGDNNPNNTPVDIGEAALEGVRGGLVPGAPQAGVVAEPLPRKLTDKIKVFVGLQKYLSPPLERVCGEQNMRQHARPGQLVQQVREVEQLQVQRRQPRPGQE